MIFFVDIIIRSNQFFSLLGRNSRKGPGILIDNGSWDMVIVLCCSEQFIRRRPLPLLSVSLQFSYCFERNASFSRKFPTIQIYSLRINCIIRLRLKVTEI